LSGTPVKRAKEEEDMADEKTREDEEPEVEGHALAGGQSEGDKVEGQSSGAHDDDDSDDVEAHLFPEGKTGVQPIVAEGNSEG
jgi:hypothetical protein